MSTSASIAVQTLRAEHRRLRDGTMVLRLWGMLRGEWRRMIERTSVAAKPGPRAHRL